MGQIPCDIIAMEQGSPPGTGHPGGLPALLRPPSPAIAAPLSHNRLHVGGNRDICSPVILALSPHEGATTPIQAPKHPI